MSPFFFTCTHCIVEKSKVEEAEEVTIDGWVARNKDNSLYLFIKRTSDIMNSVERGNLGYKPRTLTQPPPIIQRRDV